VVAAVALPMAVAAERLMVAAVAGITANP